MTRKSSMDDIGRLQELLSIDFDDIGLLGSALVHSSYTNENYALGLESNERLEYLGDAVLQLCISHILVKRFPDYSEGRLSKFRAELVNEKPLAEMSKFYSLGDFILLGNGEDASGGRFKNSILADTFEALLAAIYLDKGFDYVLSFITRAFMPLIDAHTSHAHEKDPKSLLQEYCHKYGGGNLPHYAVTKESGPDHDKLFQVMVSTGGTISGYGTGKSIKEAEQNAARKLLETIKDMDD